MSILLSPLILGALALQASPDDAVVALPPEDHVIVRAPGIEIHEAVVSAIDDYLACLNGQDVNPDGSPGSHVRTAEMEIELCQSARRLAMTRADADLRAFAGFEDAELREIEVATAFNDLEAQHLSLAAATDEEVAKMFREAGLRD